MQYYDKECALYTCVVQNKTFDEAIQEILGAMDNADARELREQILDMDLPNDMLRISLLEINSGGDSCS